MFEQGHFIINFKSDKRIERNTIALLFTYWCHDFHSLMSTLLSENPSIVKCDLGVAFNANNSQIVTEIMRRRAMCS